MTRSLKFAAALSLALSGTAISAPAFADIAIFAGGCFWCVESDFDKVPGVTNTVSGYIGGETENPNYDTYISGGHREAVKITYDPQTVTYEELVDVLLKSVDVTDDGGQFCDRGFGYTSAIYPVSQGQADEAKAVKAKAQEQLGEMIVTPIEPVTSPSEFTAAEDYHQNYYKSDDRILSRFGFGTKAKAYKGYREGCGRDEKVRKIWGDSAFAGIPGMS